MSVQVANFFGPQYTTSQELRQLPRIEVFVDEYGDRGFTTKSSPVFAMTAVLVPTERIVDVKVVVGGLKNVINTPKPLHWVEHFTPKQEHASRRALAARLIAGLPDVRVIYVVAHKGTLISGERLQADKDLFYNYMTKLLLERVAFEARDWPGGARLAVARLSAVKNMHHEGSVDYLEGVRRQGKTKAPMEHILWPPRWYDPSKFDGLQLADLYMGMFGTALSGAPDDPTCARFLLEHRHQLRRSWSGQVLGYGVKVYGDARFLTERAWWGDFVV
jgi:hypothetical protein